MGNPTLPDYKTLAARALMRLLTGRRFTSRDFQDETASYRLSSFIEELRNRHGWRIDTRMETAPTNDPIGRTAKYGRYSINPEVLVTYKRALGVRLDKFIEVVRMFEAGTPKNRQGVQGGGQ